MLPEHSAKFGNTEDRIERGGLRLAGSPTTGIDRARGAVVISGKGTEVGYHPALPLGSVGLKTVRVITEECRIRIRNRQVRIRCYDPCVIEQAETIAIHRTITVGAAERPQVDEPISSVLRGQLSRDRERSE